VNIACWAAYRAPLQRPYALGVGGDRGFNLGMAASTAAGNSPFEHTQVGFHSPEPFWNVVVATLAWHRPERVPWAYDAVTPISLLAVGLGLYFGLRRGDGEAEGWERVLMVFGVLGLASLSMSPQPPTPAFWMSNFFFKPNHGTAFGVLGVVAGLASRPRIPVIALGAVMGLLAWVFLMSWAYVLPGLLLGMLLKPRTERDWRALALAVGLSALVAAPYVRHLSVDYAPSQAHGAATHMWDDQRGLPLAIPNWSTLDLGPLLTLGVAGLWLFARRRTPRDCVVLGMALAAGGLWLVSIPAAFLGAAPEPDDLHYYLRFTLALAAGAGLAAVARHVETQRGLRIGRGHVLALAACLPFSFPSYWDPPSMDRYYAESLRPVGPRIVAYAQWVRENTPRDAVFAAGKTAATYIPALAGRRVLLADAGELRPRNYEERKEAERILLTAEDPELVRRTAQTFGVRYVAIDPELVDEYRARGFANIARSAAYRTVFANAAVRIVEVLPPSERNGS